MADVRIDPNGAFVLDGADLVIPEHDGRIADQINEAVELASSGAERAAALAFSLAREMCVSMCDQGALAAHIDRHVAPLVREREQYRALVAQRRSASNHLLILADSLGLPRPSEKDTDELGAEHTYQMKLLDRLPEHDVQSYCQRYFTTQQVLELLTNDPDLGTESDVVVHVGLNDCANRIFLESERLALDLLSPSTKEAVVAFGQRYRRLLLRHLPSHHYVPLDEFRTNLESIVQLLQARQARRIALATIILPPTRFWAGTPGINRNFGRYNLILMDVADQTGAVLFDVDRHVWERHGDGMLLDDGMHLSRAGHQLFADTLTTLLA